MSDTPVEFQVEALGEHEYLVTIRNGEESSQSRLLASQGILEQLGVDSSMEQTVIRETTAFLLEHQPAVDLPPAIDLDDVAAAYDDYVEELRLRLTA